MPTTLSGRGSSGRRSRLEWLIPPLNKGRRFHNYRAYDSKSTGSWQDPLYPSRNNYPAASIALFARADEKVAVFEDIDLIEHADWPRFVDSYHMGVEPDPGPVDPDDDAAT